MSSGPKVLMTPVYKDWQSQVRGLAQGYAKAHYKGLYNLLSATAK